MMNAKSRFEATRAAISRLNEVKALIMYGCDDWQPEGVRTSVATSDPTATAAIRAVDELADKLDALRAEESELEDLIGTSLAIIAAVRRGFGEKYADVLDSRYIDCEKWTEIAERYESMQHGKETVTTRTVQNWAQIAFEWIDSVGVSRLLRKDYDV